MAAPSPWRSLSVAGLIGLDVAICVIIGYWLGKRVDLWLEIDPFGMLIGLFGGLAAGLLSIIPIIRKLL